ncbi:NfeD family protein [Helicovermis profundi]|uniref:NfeD family protein n=1 Tax=Helicovermis profundi TaxID=3065157 RepID=A0AAU9E928_9FIRM|nr:NfeD family protein [Clostridia bacterium S502]
MSVLFQLSVMWVILIIAFIVIEALTFGLASIWFALGSLAALILSLLGFGFVIQLIAFLVVSIILLFFTRPIAKKYLKIGTEKTNIDSLIGKVGVVVKRIERHKVGQVKVEGQIWSAKNIDNDTIYVDSQVEVLRIEGVKVIVKIVD